MPRFGDSRTYKTNLISSDLVGRAADFGITGDFADSKWKIYYDVVTPEMMILTDSKGKIMD